MTLEEKLRQLEECNGRQAQTIKKQWNGVAKPKRQKRWLMTEVERLSGRKPTSEEIAEAIFGEQG